MEKYIADRSKFKSVILTECQYFKILKLDNCVAKKKTETERKLRKK